MVARFFVDENDLALGKALAAVQRTLVDMSDDLTGSWPTRSAPWASRVRDQKLISSPG